MERVNVLILEGASNCPVVQLSSRRHPGMVIQGDTMFSFFKLAHEAREFLAAGRAEEAKDLTEQLEDALGDYLDIYEAALTKRGLKLPYFRDNTEERDQDS